jgi:hypothetical protein
MMAKYRKKPVVIEAVQWKGDNLDEVRDICEGNIIERSHPDKSWLSIRTICGQKFVPLDFYVVSSGLGKAYAVDKDVFLSGYELVEGGD